MNTTDKYTRRISLVQDEMKLKGIDLLAIAPSPNMRYLAGFSPFADERPCALFLSQRNISFVVPTLNADQVELKTGLETIRWDDDKGPTEAYQKAITNLNQKRGNVIAIDNTMRADALVLIFELLEPNRIELAEKVMKKFRIIKSNEEIERLANAAKLTDGAILAGIDACHPGLSELEVADHINNYYRKNGVELVDFIFVASGPNGAFPHHDTGSRKLEMGDLVILDIGATLDGYKSDLTRTISLGKPSEEIKNVYEVVKNANLAGKNAAIPGALAKNVDKKTRDVINEAGYGPYFTHRTGHGIGLEVHEPPWISASSETVLEPGMVFSIEPGIYLQDQFGIRIEDIVVVQKAGCRTFSNLGHDLIIKE